VSVNSARGMSLAPALRRLIEAARLERGHAALDSAEREFYSGVDAAAQGQLHPEVLAARRENWLEYESHVFADGYLTMAADIAAAICATEPPAHFALPAMPGRRSGAKGETT
jgi:hypothetical protein